MVCLVAEANLQQLTIPGVCTAGLKEEARRRMETVYGNNESHL